MEKWKRKSSLLNHNTRTSCGVPQLLCLHLCPEEPVYQRDPELRKLKRSMRMIFASVFLSSASLSTSLHRFMHKYLYLIAVKIEKNRNMWRTNKKPISQCSVVRNGPINSYAMLRFIGRCIWKNIRNTRSIPSACNITIESN